MKIDFSTVMKAIDGQPINHFDLAEETLRRFAAAPADQTVGALQAELQAFSKVMPMTAFTLGKIACDALLGTYKDEPALAGEERVKRFRLAEKVMAGGVIDVKAEDVVLIKKMVPKMFGTVIVARAYDALEPEEAAA